MDRTAKLYKLYAELTAVKKGIEDFGTLRPNPRIYELARKDPWMLNAPDQN